MFDRIRSERDASQILLVLRRRVMDARGHLLLRSPRPNVRRVLNISGLDQVFTVED